MHFPIHFAFQTECYLNSFVPPLLYSPINLSAPKAVEEAFILEEIPHPLEEFTPQPYAPPNRTAL